MMQKTNKVFIVMGVSGCGKSAVVKELSKEIDAAVLDGDFLHPKSNILKMANGEPLNDDDRKPWLDLVNNAAFAMQRTNQFSFIVCSALKKQYRDILREGNDNLQFIYLQGDLELIKSRLEQRKGHFFKPQMLISQFNTLEEPNNETGVLVVDIAKPLDEVVKNILNII